MSPFDKTRVVLQAEQDQDRENVKLWWREASLSDKFRVWDAIQQKFDSPEMEIVSRFAQLAFTQIALDASGGQL